MEINIAIILVMVLLLGYVSSVIWKQLRQKPEQLTSLKDNTDEVRNFLPEGKDDNIIRFHPIRGRWWERDSGRSAAGAEDKGFYPLHDAVHMGDIEMVRYMLQRDYDIEEKDNLGRTPLYIAACEGKLDILEILIEHGAGINADNYEGDTPLHCAVMGANGLTKEVVKLLLEKGAAVNARNSNENTPLRLASFAGDMEVVTLLRRHGARF